MIRHKHFGFIYSLICLILIFSVAAFAGDESALFTNVAPDALFILDLSGSMAWPPIGQFMYIRQS
jgi:hypothetical protein